MAEASQNQLQVRLVTPEQIFIDGTADAVELPSRNGYLEALYGHAPLLAELGAGEVRMHGGSVGEQRYFVAWGFVEVLPDRVTILAENAVEPSAINVAQARQELERGEKMWRDAGEESKRYSEANNIIHEAQERIASVESAGKSS
ncbi:MAG TPA: ATP synthase F1 subunit epsilon [Acidobacteriaceae bacterium]|jgi:F-type H+-transporting ATPase subunit epsilon|nr:ATP synthase F1 subunit epsilon [Acidobacteriaceae bacterium]